MCLMRGVYGSHDGGFPLFLADLEGIRYVWATITVHWVTAHLS